MSDNNQCLPLIRQIHTAMEKEANNTLRENDLTISQAYLLITLCEMPNGSCSFKEMERQLQTGQSTTVGLVKRLRMKGFVDCSTDALDKRIRIVSITPAGRDICDQAHLYIEQAFSRMTDGLTDTEKASLIVLLKKVYQNFQSAEDEDQIENL